MQWLHYQVHTISWFLFVFSNFSVKKQQHLKQATRTICRLMPTATFSLPALPTFLPSVLYFSLGHTLNTSFSFLSPGPCFMDIFLCSCTGGGGGGVLKAVAALRSAVEGGTKREAILFPYTRFLCGCQPPM